MKRNKYPPPLDLFDYYCSYREYVMVSTVLSEKFIYLMQIIEQTDRYPRRFRDLAEDVRDRGCGYKNSVISATARNTNLPIDVLLRCTIAYSNYDLHMASASLNGK